MRQCFHHMDCATKDSFCQVDTNAECLNILFAASWIWLDKAKSPFPDQWQRVDNLSDLHLWEDAWKQSGSPTNTQMFNEKFIAREDIFIFGHKVNRVFEAGCIGNRSKDCIGLSIVFSVSQSRQVFSKAIAVVSSIDPTLPIVGYESADDLKAAQKEEFETIGNLRILVPNNP